MISNNQAAPPQCDANCVRTNAGKAADACAPRIEAEAPSSFNWMARPNAGIFQQADPSSPGDTIVRYRGDSIRFLTADKSWLRVSYECAYDVRSGIVDFVKVRSGSLDQPRGRRMSRPRRPNLRRSSLGRSRPQFALLCLALPSPVRRRSNRRSGCVSGSRAASKFSNRTRIRGHIRIRPDATAAHAAANRKIGETSKHLKRSVPKSCNPARVVGTYPFLKSRAINDRCECCRPKHCFPQGGDLHHVKRAKRKSRSPRLHDRIGRDDRRIGRARGQCRRRERPSRGGILRGRRQAVARGTVYTGDVIQGKKVVSALDVNDLEPGQKHFLYFQGVEMPTGQHWYVSVIVAKGAKPGKRVVLVSGVHGDEMSSVHTVQTRDEPARSGGDVGHGDGSHGRVPPGPGRHAAQMAQFWQGRRSDRHEPGMARQRERPHRGQPACRAPVQPAAAAERRRRDRLPYRDDGIRCHGIQYRRHGCARDQGDGGALSRRPGLRQSCLSRCSRRSIHRCGHPVLYARDRRCHASSTSR